MCGDVAHVVSVFLQVTASAGANFAKNADAIFMETSAKENVNVHELFKAIGTEWTYWLARD